LHAQQKREEGREERPRTKREFFRVVVVSRFVALVVVLFLASSPKAKERERKEKKSKKNAEEIA